MVALAAFIAFLRASAIELRNTRVADLQFFHRDTARLALVVLVGLSVAMLVTRMTMVGRRPGRDGVAVPALLRWIRPSAFSLVRVGPLLLFLLGLSFFAMALADPYASLTREERSFPGRRIALLIDASPSMTAPFDATRLHAKAPTAEALRNMGLLIEAATAPGISGAVDDPAPTAKGSTRTAAFFTSVAAAEYLIRLRIKGKYRDLMALVEFGDESYVITPFTSDYDNILLSTTLISDATEWRLFPDKGTYIGKAIEQSIELFRAFEFLNASGNLMVIVSDGGDTEVEVGGKSVAQVLAGAVATKIPVFFVRIGYNKQLGENIPDATWKEVVERTGGKFYAAADEGTILRAMQDIDKISSGQISVKRYSTRRLRFSPYALTAIGLWSLALLLKLTLPCFSKCP